MFKSAAAQRKLKIWTAVNIFLYMYCLHTDEAMYLYSIKTLYVQVLSFSQYVCIRVMF